jgi:hypothetical protein
VESEVRFELEVKVDESRDPEAETELVPILRGGPVGADEGPDSEAIVDIILEAPIDDEIFRVIMV